MQNAQKQITLATISSKWNFFISDIPAVLLFLSILGIVINSVAFLRKKKLHLLLITDILIVAPFILIILFVTGERRFFIPLWLAVTYFASWGGYLIFTKISDLSGISQRISKIIFISSAIVYISIIIYQNYFNYILSDNIRSNSYKKYAQLLLQYFPEKAVFLVGDKSWLVGNYLIPLSKTQWKIIGSGWSWEGVENTVKRVKAALNNGEIVFVDVEEYGSWEYKDILQIIQYFQTTQYISNIYRMESN